MSTLVARTVCGTSAAGEARKSSRSQASWIHKCQLSNCVMAPCALERRSPFARPTRYPQPFDRILGCSFCCFSAPPPRPLCAGPPRSSWDTAERTRAPLAPMFGLCSLNDDRWQWGDKGLLTKTDRKIFVPREHEAPCKADLLSWSGAAGNAAMPVGTTLRPLCNACHPHACDRVHLRPLALALDSDSSPQNLRSSRPLICPAHPRGPRVRWLGG